MNGIEHIKDNNNLAKNDLCVLKRENKKSSITKKPQGNIILPTNEKKNNERWQYGWHQQKKKFYNHSALHIHFGFFGCFVNQKNKIYESPLKLPLGHINGQ